MEKLIMDSYRDCTGTLVQVFRKPKGGILRLQTSIIT